MGRKKRKWSKIDTTEAEARVVKKNADVQTQALKSEALFFTDTKGNIESRATRKKRNQALFAAREAQPAFVPRKSKACREGSRVKTSTKTHIDEPEPSLDIWSSDSKLKKSKAPANQHVTTLKKTMVSSLSVNPDPAIQKLSVTTALEADTKIREAKRDIDLKMLGQHPSQQIDPALFNESSSEDEEETANEVRQKKQRKFSVSERNKLRKLKEQERKRKQDKAAKRFQQDLNNVPAIVREVEKRAKASKKRQEEKHPRDMTVMKLSKHGRQEAFPEFMLTEDVEESNGHLRKAPLSLQVVEQQFTRFMDRNLIQPLKKQHKTAPRVGKKMSYRNSFKEDKHIFPRETPTRRPRN